MTGRHHLDDVKGQGRRYCFIGQHGLLIFVWPTKIRMSVAPGYTHMSIAPEQPTTETNHIVGFFQ